MKCRIREAYGAKEFGNIKLDPYYIKERKAYESGEDIDCR